MSFPCEGGQPEGIDLELLFKLQRKQSIGVPVTPIVSVGDRVEKGALLGTPEGLGVPLHASVKGQVSEITEDYISIAADEEQPEGYEKIRGNGSVAETAKEAGLCGLGGAGFPTYVKLETELNGGVLLINAAECEPLLKHNVAQIVESPAEVYNGALLAKRSTGAGSVIFGIKSKNAEAIERLRSVIRPEDNVSIHELPDLYPMGEERALIREALGPVLRPDQLPNAADAVVLNVETVFRLHEAVEERKPMITKSLTVAGKLKNGTDSQVFLNVPLGMRVGDVLEMAGGIDGVYGEIIMGGPFTGHACALDDVIAKPTGGLIVSIDFVNERRPMGLLICACGGNAERMHDLAAKMNANVVSERTCKQAVSIKGTLKCENPGNCPGQAEKIMEMRREGAEVLLVGNCSDCTNTVMCVAPKLKMPVYHQTDHVMRTVGHRLVRRLPMAR